MVDFCDLRMVLQELHDLLRVLRVPLKAEGQRLRALQEQKRCERRDGRALVAQQNRAHIGHKGRRACRVDERHAVIAGFGSAIRENLPLALQSNLPGVDNHAAERRAVAADELRRRMHDDVGSVFDGADQVGSSERIIDDQRNSVAVCDGGHRFDVDACTDCP